MKILLDSFAILTFLLTSLILLRPKSGWGRLGLFIPKLFVSTRIVFLALVGGILAVSGYGFYQSKITLILGLGTFLIATQYILRLVIRSHQVVQKITDKNPVQQQSSSHMLPCPWVGLWKTTQDVHWEQDISIGRNVDTNKKILVDLWNPPDTIQPSGLGIIYLHGSGWHYADKDFATRHFFHHLAGQGHVIMDVAYSLAPDVDIFGMMEDVKQAIVWMKQHADELRIKKDGVVLMGGSAGGHLALLAAYTPNDPQFGSSAFTVDTSVRAVISYYGPTDLKAQFDRFCELPSLTGEKRFERSFMDYLEHRFGFDVIPVHELLPGLLGGTPQEVPEYYTLASLDNHISPACPPTLLLQGSHDFSGAAPQVRQMNKALLNVGAISYYFELPGAEHGFDLYKPKWSPAAQAATYVTERFLASLL